MKNTSLLYADLPTPEEMSRWDAAAGERFGIPALLLMENAAQAAVQELERLVSLKKTRRILVLMGKGNNGGDGVAVARILQDKGHDVIVFATAPLTNLRSPAKEHVEMARALGVRIIEGDSDAGPDIPDDWSRPDIAIDALCGTGLQGLLRERELSYIRAANRLRQGAFVLALDIPSGLSGFTGKPMPESVRAHATVCFEAGKPGLYFPESRNYTGDLVVRRVGIPRAVRTDPAPSWHLIAPRKGAWPVPSPFQHKGAAGRVLIIGGSEGMAGAPALAAAGCLYAGAGLVHVAIPGGLAGRSFFPPAEVLVHAVGDARAWREEDAATVLELMRALSPDAVVLGPGMGRDNGVGHIIQVLLEECARPPFIVDADALFFFQGLGAERVTGRADVSCLSANLLRQQDIVTPHPGELARILPGIAGADSPLSLRESIARIQGDRPGALRSFTEVCESVLVLKGAGTLVGRRGSSIRLSSVAVATLGVGGSGDVLSGICAALLASAVCGEGNVHGFDSLDAACLGVYLHGRAGELLAGQAPVGHPAGDIARVIPLCWKELCEQ